MSAPVKSSLGIEEAGYDYPDGKSQALHHTQTAGAISISPELLEKFYLAPKIEKKGPLGKKFGNATAMYDPLPLFQPISPPHPNVLAFHWLTWMAPLAALSVSSSPLLLYHATSCSGEVPVAAVLNKCEFTLRYQLTT